MKRRPPIPDIEPYNADQIGLALFALASEMSLDPKIHRYAVSQRRNLAKSA